MPRPSARSFFNNWTNPKWSLAERIRLSTKNQMIKITNQTTCCGNHGEPGC